MNAAEGSGHASGLAIVAAERMKPRRSIVRNRPECTIYIVPVLSVSGVLLHLLSVIVSFAALLL